MRIAIATTTRADWGLLSPLASELRCRGAEVLVMAANMHYNKQLGMTVSEISADGFTPVLECRTQGTPAEVAAACLVDYERALTYARPDCIVCLGDRFEMLSIAQAAVMARVPVVHIAGGAVSEGAMDDAFRHAITKLSYLHLTECEQYRRRVISMGEDPARVLNTGAIGVSNILSVKPIDRTLLEHDLAFPLDTNTLLCTMHAATLDTTLTSVEQYHALLQGIDSAMKQHSRLRILFTYPNNDTDPAPLIAELEKFAAAHSGRVRLIPSLGMRRYLSVLHYIGGVIGNSSSGIVEVPSIGIPVLDIGIRQQGRMRARSVLHAPCSATAIAAGINTILGDEARRLASRRENPYARPDTLSLMADAILSSSLSVIKPFYDPCDTSI